MMKEFVYFLSLVILAVFAQVAILSIARYSYEVYGFIFSYPDTEPDEATLEQLRGYMAWNTGFIILFNIMLLKSFSSIVLDKCLQCKLNRTIQSIHFIDYFILVTGLYISLTVFPPGEFAYNLSELEYFYQLKKNLEVDPAESLKRRVLFGLFIGTIWM